MIASPSIQDLRFSKAVVYVCAHSQDGTIGIVINNPLNGIKLSNIAEQLGFAAQGMVDRTIFAGGPIDPGRGFILHSTDYFTDSSLKINKDVALTATANIIKDIVNNQGPKRCLIALGYAGWGARQLDNEIADHAWLVGGNDPDLLFDADAEGKWTKASKSAGVADLSYFSHLSGNA